MGVGRRVSGAEGGGWRAALTLGVLASSLVGASSSRSLLPPPASAVQGCPAPRISQWAAIRDSLWPLIVHRDGDDAWAHLDSTGLPRRSATWCNPLQADSAAIAAGRDLYAGNCATCHGDLGKGDGPGAAAADPKPYDFTRPEFAGMREAPGTAVVYATLTRGIEGTAMTGFAQGLSGWERLAVIAYVTSLPGREAVARSREWADTLRTRQQEHSVR